MTEAQEDLFLDDLAGKFKIGSNAETVTFMLLNEGGATLPELAKATGWSANTIRGFISGTLKKRLGLNVQSERDFIITEMGRKFFTAYWIAL